MNPQPTYKPCPNCGEKMPEPLAFCPRCDFDTRRSAPPPPPLRPVPPTAPPLHSVDTTPSREKMLWLVPVGIIALAFFGLWIGYNYTYEHVPSFRATRLVKEDDTFDSVVSKIGQPQQQKRYGASLVCVWDYPEAYYTVTFNINTGEFLREETKYK